MDARKGREAGVGRAADMRIRRLVNELPPVERRIICWLYGIDCTPIDPDEVARRLNLSVDEMWLRLSRGVEQVGYRAVTEVAA